MKADKQQRQMGGFANNADLPVSFSLEVGDEPSLLSLFFGPPKQEIWNFRCLRGERASMAHAYHALKACIPV